MSADKMPPLPDTDYGLAFYDEGGMHEAPGQGYTTDQMHTYARAYAAEQTRELVEALRYYANESFDGHAQPNGAVAQDALAKHKEQA